MRERKGEYFLKIVNEERYQQLFDHPEELRKIITYAKRLMQYEKCFDYSFRDNCMKMELLQVAVQRILQEYGIEVGEVYDLSIELLGLPMWFLPMRMIQKLWNFFQKK